MGERSPSARYRRTPTLDTGAYLTPHPAQQPSATSSTDRLLGNRVKKTLHRLHRPLLPVISLNSRMRAPFEKEIPRRIGGSPNWFQTSEIRSHLCGAREMRVRFCRRMPSTSSNVYIVTPGGGLVLHPHTI